MALRPLSGVLGRLLESGLPDIVVSIDRVVMLVSDDNVDDGLRYQMLLVVEEEMVVAKMEE